MEVLMINFTFLDWENGKVSKFRNDITALIIKKLLRVSLLLSTELDDVGVTFYLITSDDTLALLAKSKLLMMPAILPAKIESLGVECGNQDLLL